MANKFKNEMTVKLGETEILLRPDFNNLASFESQVITLDQFSFNLVKGKILSLTQMIQVLFYFQAEKKLNLEQISQLVTETQGIQVWAQLMPFLSQVCSGHDNFQASEAKRKPKVEMTEAEKKS